MKCIRKRTTVKTRPCLPSLTALLNVMARLLKPQRSARAKVPDVAKRTKSITRPLQHYRHGNKQHPCQHRTRCDAATNHPPPRCVTHESAMPSCATYTTDTPAAHMPSTDVTVRFTENIAKLSWTLAVCAARGRSASLVSGTQIRCVSDACAAPNHFDIACRSVLTSQAPSARATSVWICYHSNMPRGTRHVSHTRRTIVLR